MLNQVYRCTLGCIKFINAHQGVSSLSMHIRVYQVYQCTFVYQVYQTTFVYQDYQYTLGCIKFINAYHAYQFKLGCIKCINAHQGVSSLAIHIRVYQTYHCTLWCIKFTNAHQGVLILSMHITVYQVNGTFVAIDIYYLIFKKKKMGLADAQSSFRNGVSKILHFWISSGYMWRGVRDNLPYPQLYDL